MLSTTGTKDNRVLLLCVCYVILLLPLCSLALRNTPPLSSSKAATPTPKLPAQWPGFYTRQSWYPVSSNTTPDIYYYHWKNGFYRFATFLDLSTNFTARSIVHEEPGNGFGYVWTSGGHCHLLANLKKRIIKSAIPVAHVDEDPPLSKSSQSQCCMKILFNVTHPTHFHNYTYLGTQDIHGTLADKFYGFREYAPNKGHFTYWWQEVGTEIPVKTSSIDSTGNAQGTFFHDFQSTPVPPLALFTPPTLPCCDNAEDVMFVHNMITFDVEEMIPQLLLKQLNR